MPRNEKKNNTFLAIKKLLRKIFISFCYYIGIIDLVRYMNRKKITIFMIHGVIQSEMDSNWKPLRKQLNVEAFDCVLEALSQKYKFISIDDATEIISGRKTSENNCIAITFDDGYRNNLINALPILKKYNAKATIYISTGNIDRRTPFWFDRLDYILQKLPKGQYEEVVHNRKICIDTTERERLIKSYKKLRKMGKSLHGSDFEMLFEFDNIGRRYEKQCNTSIVEIFEDDPWISLLRWDEIKEQNGKNGITFGSHTVDHIRLGLVEDDIIEFQLKESKNRIENILGINCKHLAYPNGSFNSNVARVAQMCGYETGLTTVEGKNIIGENLLELKRKPFPDTLDKKEALYYTSGIEELTKKIKRIMKIDCDKLSY